MLLLCARVSRFFAKQKRKIKLSKTNKNTMKKPLELDENTARRLYPTASPEFKELLEQNFGIDFFKQKITDRIKGYLDVLDIWNVSASDDDVKVKGFNEEENKLIKNLIKKIRTVKVYNEGKVPKRGDRRYYPYYDVSSGFVFYSSSYGVSLASTSSASRLAFINEELTRDYAKKFSDIEENIIDVK